MSDSDEEIIIDEDTQSYMSQNSQIGQDFDHDTVSLLLKHTVDDFREILPDVKIEIDQKNLITIRLPTSILPLAMNAVYGFIDSIYLLEINLQLKDVNWTEKPVILNYSNPTYKTNFIGKSLIQDVFTNFFSNNYEPRSRYKCSSFLLTPNGVPNQNALMQLLAEGFDNKAAESALLLCANDIDSARNFLITGDIPVSAQLPVQYVECPLVYLIFEIGEAFFDISDHCCMCRKELPTPGLKPSVCDSEMCHFQFECLGVGTSVLQEIKRDPVVADLLVCIFSAAQSSNFLNPAPPKELLSKSTQIIANLPPMKVIAESNKNDTDMIKKYGNDAVDLLRWVLLSNRSHLITLPDELRLREFPGTVQFMTLLSTPQAELSFKRLLGGDRSIFLWHGSGGDRWHAILRNGLKNATGTAMQANGAAMGAGIYLAANSGTSWGYSRPQAHAYKGSALGPVVNAIAMCEVANTSKLADNGWAHVLQDEAAVIVRFLLMGTPFATDVLASPPTNIPTLDAVLKYKARAALEGIADDVTIPPYRQLNRTVLASLQMAGQRRKKGANMPKRTTARHQPPPPPPQPPKTSTRRKNTNTVNLMANVNANGGWMDFQMPPSTIGVVMNRNHPPPPPPPQMTATTTTTKSRRATRSNRSSAQQPPVLTPFQSPTVLTSIQPPPVSTPVQLPTVLTVNPTQIRRISTGRTRTHNTQTTAPPPSPPLRGGITLTEFQDDPYSESSASSMMGTPSNSPARAVVPNPSPSRNTTPSQISIPRISQIPLPKPTSNPTPTNPIPTQTTNPAPTRQPVGRGINATVVESDDDVIEVVMGRRDVRKEGKKEAEAKRVTQEEIGSINLLSPQGQNMVVVKQEPGVFSLFPSQQLNLNSDSDSDSESSTDLFK